MMLRGWRTACRTAGLAALMALLSSCGGGAYNDGVYSAKSESNEDGSWAEVTITLKNNRIVGCEYTSYQKNGDIKDENYGKATNQEEFYQKAQNAVAAMKIYESELARTGDLNEVDRISGATLSYSQFTEAVSLALEQARN